ncbi:MAG TPA: hypothetical protein VHW60_02335, partial [Caulobacteraceae bacterium]|nr:hypothetical protein [Caulobacteraceae bacterium]
VNLENALGQVDPKSDNLHADGLLCWVLTRPAWHIDAVRGPSTHHPGIRAADIRDLPPPPGQEILDSPLRGLPG